MKHASKQVIKSLTLAALVFLSLYIFSSSALSAPPPSGADLFKSKCAMCHGPDGSGNTPMGKRLNLRDLRSSDVQKHTDDELTAIITNGKPPMPAYGKTLSASDIHELVAYLRSIAKS
ncbi:MAG TPA: cytochrome c [Bryobacteraceae bacterium]|nr:cytochrome c [Bryobacteraceae bacterium]